MGRMRRWLTFCASLAALIIGNASCLFARPVYSDSNNLCAFSIDWRGLSEGKLDLSFLLAKPAGHAGFTTVKSGHFRTADGKRLRIWGVNVTRAACFPEKEGAPAVASFLARLGINGVRFHFLDSHAGGENSLFKDGLDTTQVLDPGQLDRLDFFVAELKKQGIYSNFNLNVGRTFRKEDGVADYELLGLAKAVTLFDNHIIDLEKEYARQLLTHTNPYTGNAYVNEPALILVEIVNENSLVEAWFDGRLLGENTRRYPSTWSDIPASYARQLDRRYNDWLKTAVSPSELLQMKREARVNQEDMLPRLRPSEFTGASRLRFHTEAEFILQLERRFFVGMYRFLKDDLKVHAHVAGNSDHNHSKGGYALLSTLAQLDVVDGHVYWQHPSSGLDPETGSGVSRIDNTPMVNDPFHSTVVQLSRSAVLGKPYTISETNHPYPNEYACEGVGILAAYGLLQDWDGVFFYTLEHDDPRAWSTKIPRNFDLCSDPVKMANIAVASLMWHRGDLAAAPSVTLRNYDREQLIEGIREDRKAWPLFTPGFAAVTPLIHRTRIRSFEGGRNAFPEHPLTSPTVSETHEVTWIHADQQGLVIVDHPVTQAVMGFVGARSLQTENMAARMNNPFGSILVSSMDGLPICKTRRILLATTARAGLSHIAWSEDRTFLREWGERPTVIEPITGELLFRNLGDAKGIMLMPLDGSGQVLQRQAVTPNARGEFVCSLSSTVTVWYIVEVER